MHKLLQQLEEILRITFDSENNKTKIELDEKLFVKFTRRKGENLAYIHDIARNSRMYLEAGDIKKMMLLYFSMNIAIDRVAKNANALHELYKSYILLMTHKNTTNLLTIVGIEEAIPISTQNSPFWMEFIDDFLKIPLFFNEQKRCIDQTVVSLFSDAILF